MSHYAGDNNINAILFHLVFIKKLKILENNKSKTRELLSANETLLLSKLKSETDFHSPRLGTSSLKQLGAEGH